jgi:hypothetical protein
MSEEREMIVDALEQFIPQTMWTLSDLTEEQRYATTGNSNTIASTAMHAIRDIDRNVQTVCQGKPDIWTAKGYPAKFGIEPDMRHAGLAHDIQLALRLEPWDEFLNYAREVLDSTLDYVKNSSEGELLTVVPNARMDTYHSGDYSKIRVIRGRLSHATMHLGELFVLRGAQGLMGAPEGRV